MQKSWSINSWTKFHAHQQPNWHKNELYLKIISEISTYPPLVFAEDFSFLVRLLLFRPCGKTRKHNYISHKWLKSNEIPFSDAKGSNSQSSWHNR